jgi:hypothetical protein
VKAVPKFGITIWGTIAELVCMDKKGPRPSHHAHKRGQSASQSGQDSASFRSHRVPMSLGCCDCRDIVSLWSLARPPLGLLEVRAIPHDKTLCPFISSALVEPRVVAPLYRCGEERVSLPSQYPPHAGVGASCVTSGWFGEPAHCLRSIGF